MNRYWLTPGYEDGFYEKVTDINQTYKTAPERAKQGQRTESVDEMTGVQALERKHPGLPMLPGKVERREFEYIRHGTLSFTCNIDVATGELVACTAGKTRNEQDFVEHIKSRVASDLRVSQWHFISDNLNTHMSESLVCYVAEESDLVIDLGVKGESGILKSMASRADFLSDPTHRTVVEPVETSFFITLRNGCRACRDTRFLDEPDRDLVQYPGSKSHQARQLYFSG